MKNCMPLCVSVRVRRIRRWHTVSCQINTTFNHFKSTGLWASAGITHASVSLTSDTVMKSCTYKGFCEKAHGSSSGAKMECCFGDDCNGPHKSHSHGDHHRNSAGALASSPLLLMTSLLLRTAFGPLWTTALLSVNSDLSFPPHHYHPVIFNLIHPPHLPLKDYQSTLIKEIF